MAREVELGDFPGAVAPDRSYRVDAGGVGIALHEWGSEQADPLFLVHGGFDFALTDAKKGKPHLAGTIR